MSVGWRAFFLAMHIATVCFLWMIICEFNFVTPSLYEAAKNENAADALHLALQIGRLDLVTLFLAIVAFIGFWSYGHVVDRAARKETEEIAPKEISKILRDDPTLWLKVIRDNPLTFQSVIKEALQSENEMNIFDDGAFGDKIAKIVDEEEVQDGNT